MTISIRFLFTSSEPQYTISISEDLLNVTTPDGVNYTRGDLCTIEVRPTCVYLVIAHADTLLV